MGMELWGFHGIEFFYISGEMKLRVVAQFLGLCYLIFYLWCLANYELGTSFFSKEWDGMELNFRWD
jgi:hypothetical protein